MSERKEVSYRTHATYANPDRTRLDAKVLAETELVYKPKSLTLQVVETVSEEWTKQQLELDVYSARVLLRGLTEYLKPKDIIKVIPADQSAFLSTSKVSTEMFARIDPERCFFVIVGGANFRYEIEHVAAEALKNTLVEFLEGKEVK